MKYAVISDIHGNLEALEATIEAISAEKVDRLLCLGDIVGYGANPVECIAIIKDLSPVTVCGNHDAACRNTLDLDYFTERAAEALIWTRNRLSQEDINYLKSLKLGYKNDDLILTHGTLYEPEEFHYMVSPYEADLSFKQMKTKICFVGHTHLPGVFILKSDKIQRLRDNKVNLLSCDKVIVNTGSVGQPRDRDPRVSYAIYDMNSKEVEIKRVAYDVRKAQRKILNAHLPASLAERLIRAT